MLGIVGVMAFGIGTWFGRAWERATASTAQAASSVRGKCVYRKASGAEWTPDDGAVVIFLPIRANVGQTIPLLGLRPGDDPGLSRRGMAQLRDWGGARAVCESDGHFEAALAPNQEYWIIAMSAHKKRPVTSPISTSDVRKTERFFTLVGDGFGPGEVKCSQKRLTGGERLDFAF